MNNEQNDNDKLVSDAYRDLAQETAPKALDDAVLRMAAAKPASQKSGPPAWMKPAAWAATIGLALAIVIERPEVTEPALMPSPASAPPAAAIEEAFSAEDANVVQEAEDMARMRDGPDQTDAVSKARQEQAKRRDSDSSEDAVASRAYGAPASVSADSVAYEVDEMKKESVDSSACSEISRQDAASWYDCVLQLRDTDRSAEADREMRRLLENFPEFQPNK